MIKHSWLESGGVYGYRKVHDDLREVGEDCGRHRVARLMRLEGLRSQTGYRRRPGKYGRKPIDALLMAVWRRKPKQEVMVHSDQGSQSSSTDWRSFLKANNLVASMSRRGNCHDNAVVESFFQLLKWERIKRKIYTTRQEVRSDVFDYIEMFYNAKRRHGFNNQLSPIEFEKHFAMSLQGV